MLDAFAFSANAVLPIVFLIVLGYLFKRSGLLTTEFLNVGNKLVFRVLLPVMLFLNVYSIERIRDVNIGFIIYGVAAVFAVFFLGIAVGCMITRENAKRGSLIQAVFRSNYAIIGIPLAASLFGEKGAAAAGVMSAFCVPLFNILSVITLTVFGKKDDKKRPDLMGILRDIIRNPLIIGTFSGLAVLAVREVLVKNGISFRLNDISVVFRTLETLKSMCTPLALIVLGGKFEFRTAARLKREIILGTLIRTLAVPILGLGTAYFLGERLHLGGEHFASYVGVFATPVAVASAVMAKEMGADEELAGQLVIWTTLAGTFTIFIYVTILRSVGIF